MNYAYDFNYSIQLDTMPIAPLHQQPKEQFTFAAQLLRQLAVFANRQAHHFVQLLSKQSLFVKIGTLTSEITEIILSFIPKSIELADRLDSLREQLCECTKELNVILGRQKDYYLNIAILALTLIQTKVLEVKYGKKIERSQIFHILHWEIKGYHSTNIAFENIEAQSLSKTKLQQYFEGKKFEEQKSEVSTSLSFGDIGRSITLQKQKMTRFQLAMNKQNHYANIARQNMLGFKKEKTRKI